MSFWNRFTSTLSVAKAHSTAFASLGTALTTLLAVPLLEITFQVFLARDLNSTDLSRVILAAALISVPSAIISGMVDRTVLDRNLGLYQEIHLSRIVDLAYWFGVAILPVALSLIPALCALSTLLFIPETVESSQISLFILSLPIAIIVGILLGIFACGIAGFLSDPYFGGTILSLVLPISAGVIVPVSLYPSLLQNLCNWLPMSHLSNALSSNHTMGTLEVSAVTPAMFGLEILLAIPWTIIGLLTVRYAVHLQRNGKKFEIA